MAGFSDGSLFAVDKIDTPSPTVTRVLTDVECDTVSHVVTLPGGEQLLSCLQSDIFKVTGMKKQILVRNECANQVDISFSRPNGDQSGTGTLDSLCRPKEVVTVANAAKSTLTLGTASCTPRQVRRDRLKPERHIVSCGARGDPSLYGITGGTVTPFSFFPDRTYGVLVS